MVKIHSLTKDLEVASAKLTPTDISAEKFLRGLLKFAIEAHTGCGEETTRLSAPKEPR